MVLQLIEMGGLKMSNSTTFFKSAAERERDSGPGGIYCLINLAFGSPMNRLPATFYFPAVLNYKFRYVKYSNMLNVTSGNSP